jgi:peptidoglycan/xylan/chitin deacetylase (PgdA/CDA1 family)
MGLGIQPRIARATFRLNSLATRHLPRRPRLLVLTYHRVGHRHELWPDASSLAECTTAGFEAQMAWLREHASVLDIEAVLQILDGARPAPDRPVLITFDDGYREDLARVRPCCERLGIRPLVFLPTAFVGTARRFWWDRVAVCVKTAVRRELRVQLDSEVTLPLTTVAEREQATERLTAHLKGLSAPAREELVADLEREVGSGSTALSERPGVLDWEEARALRCCFDFGAHTVTHPVLSSLGIEELRRELSESKAEVARHLGGCHTFAIPFGGGSDYAAETAGVAAELGYRAVFSLEDSLRAPVRTGDCWMVDRLTLNAVQGAEGLAAKVTWPEIFVPKWSRLVRERLAPARTV